MELCDKQLHTEGTACDATDGVEGSEGASCTTEDTYATGAAFPPLKPHRFLKEQELPDAERPPREHAIDGINQSRGYPNAIAPSILSTFGNGHVDGDHARPDLPSFSTGS